MRKLRFLVRFCLLAILPNAPVQAHIGPHESEECFIDIEDIRLRFNGYQFHGPHPDKLYCHYFPELGDIIIKIDALQSLHSQDIALEWLEMNDVTQLLAGEPFFRSSKSDGWQPFANNLHSLRNNVTRRGVYGIRVRLQDEQGAIRQRHHYFLVGFPVMQILLSLAGLLLLVIAFFFIKQLRR